VHLLADKPIRVGDYVKLADAVEGHVVDMPFEPACLPLKIKSYPAEVLGGLVFIYMGPEPRPLLPRWEGMVREDLSRSLTFEALVFLPMPTSCVSLQQVQCVRLLPPNCMTLDTGPDDPPAAAIRWHLPCS